MVLASSRKA